VNRISFILMLVIVWSGAAAVPARAQVSPGPLARSHEQLDTVRTCTKCHEHGDQAMDERCLDCHGGIRRLVTEGAGFHGRGGRKNCSGCHPDHAGRDFDLIEWEDGSEAAFRHQRTGWPLTGGHATLKCAKCHIPEFQQDAYLKDEPPGDRARTWLGLSTDCFSCHEDRHKGELGNDCARCHGTLKFKPVARLDHSKSNYPLTGKHSDVACNKCHLVPDRVFMDGSDGKQYPRFTGLAYRECSDCHRDTHAGALGPACASCHVTSGFEKVDRSRFDHRKTRWPLLGKHAAVKCESCHDPVRAWGRKPAFGRCADCHADVHSGAATLAGQVVDCAACHTETGFRPSTYTVARHRKAKYALDGKHAAVDCSKCHRKLPGQAKVLMRPSFSACMDCHEDSHGGQLSGRSDRGVCESCHMVAGWKPSTYEKEKHNLLPVTLEGKHGEVACAACHGPLRPGLGPVPAGLRTGKAGVALLGVETECRSCHLDVHNGRFEPAGQRPAEDGCRTCHGTNAFVPSTLSVESHDKFRYVLKGGHRAVPCFECHKPLAQPPSSIHLLKAEGVVRDLDFIEPNEHCSDCHLDPHAGQFAHRTDHGACEGCHDVDRFRPASKFDHERDAEFALKGGHAGVACERCHNKTKTPEGRQVVVYRRTVTECRDCHRKPEATGRK
jgi:hypothetical protein